MRYLRLTALGALLLGLSAEAQTSRTRLLDMTADVLEPGESEVGLLWGRYARGVVPGLELEANLAAYLATLVNLKAEYQFIRRDDLRVSAQAAGYWFAAGASKEVDVTAVAAPLWLHATTPLRENLELTLGLGYRFIYFADDESTQQFRSMQSELTVARYDRKGAFLVTLKAPILRTQAVSAKVLGKGTAAGSLTLDDMNAWSVLVARDHVFGRSGHWRLGIGYRNRPGIVLIESIGRAVIELDLYWR